MISTYNLNVRIKFNPNFSYFGKKKHNYYYTQQIDEFVVLMTAYEIYSTMKELKILPIRIILTKKSYP
jgi:hypothetical protein